MRNFLKNFLPVGSGFDYSKKTKELKELTRFLWLEGTENGRAFKKELRGNNYGAYALFTKQNKQF